MSLLGQVCAGKPAAFLRHCCVCVEPIVWSPCGLACLQPAPHRLPACHSCATCLVLQVLRVLKPGGTFVFVQRMRGGPLQPLLGGGGGSVGEYLVLSLSFPFQPFPVLSFPVLVLNSPFQSFPASTPAAA